jgi:hypothetical protein
MLRRTVEVLRQIPNAYGVPLSVANIAYDAAKAMDRFPVADADSAPPTDQPVVDSAGVGFGPDGLYKLLGTFHDHAVYFKAFIYMSIYILVYIYDISFNVDPVMA